jgi:hypothetical protein
VKTVWKYLIRRGRVHEQLWAPGTKVVHFESAPNDMERANDDHDALRFWVEHDPSLDRSNTGRKVNLRVFGTGDDIPDHFQHCGTTICGRYVWHLYCEYL